MPHLPSAPDLLISLTTGLLSAWLLIGWTRAIGRADRWLGLIVGVGVVARLTLGAALFWVSYADGPLKALHTGDGFWALAPDARSYFLMAAAAAEHGLGSIPSGSASPSFVAVLALWMKAVGAVPTAAALFNTLLACGACRLIAHVLLDRADGVSRHAAWLIITGISLSPGLILFGAQGLKDQFVVTLLCVLAVNVFRVVGPVLQSPRPPTRATTASLAGMSTAVFLLGGVRPYIAFFAVLVLAATVVALAAGLAGLRGRVLARGALLTCGLWVCFMVGAGAYYSTYARQISGPLHALTGHLLPDSFCQALTTGAVGGADRLPPATPADALESARDGFVRTAGGTSLAGLDTARGADLLMLSVRVAKGLAVLLVPISALRAVGVVEFSGGRGLLALTDLDSLFNLVSLLVVSWLGRQWVRCPRHRAYAFFGVALAAITIAPMAYVVTNYGTLFRLRLMVMVMVWLWALACAPVRPQGLGADAPLAPS